MNKKGVFKVVRLLLLLLLIGAGCQSPAEKSAVAPSGKVAKAPAAARSNPAIKGEDILEVISTAPASPAVLEAGEKFEVKVFYQLGTVDAAEIWVRPYFFGQTARGYGAHHLVHVSRAQEDSGMVEGWFLFEGSAQVDEIRVMMRESQSQTVIKTISQKVDLKWRGDKTAEEVMQARKSASADSNPPAAAAAKTAPCAAHKDNKPCPIHGGQKPPADTTVYPVMEGNSPVLGSAAAPVMIVYFADLECPYCAREYPKLRQIQQEYPDKVCLVFKHYPLSFHKNAPYAHAACVLAQQKLGSAGFWQMQDLIMANPKKLAVADLRAYAEQLGLDLAAFDAVMADPQKITPLIMVDQPEAAKCKVNGTPTVLINGLKLEDRSPEGYKTRIDGILGKP